MAFWLNAKVYNPTRQLSFFMDDDNDVSNLPTSSSRGTQTPDTSVNDIVGIGSSALSIDSGKVYILNSEDSWVEKGSGGNEG